MASLTLILHLLLVYSALESFKVNGSCLLPRKSIDLQIKETVFDRNLVYYGYKYIVTYRPNKLNSHSNVTLKLCSKNCLSFDYTWKIIHCLNEPVRPVMMCEIPSSTITSLFHSHTFVITISGISCNTSFSDANYSFTPAVSHVIPLPPQNVTALDITQRSVKLSWKGPPSTRLHAPQYLVKYHSEFQDKNLTENCQTNEIWTFGNLHAGAQYWFWFITQLERDEMRSIPGGPVYLRTMEDVPSKAQEISLSSHNLNKDTRHILVNLKYPPRVNWNGNLSMVTILHCQTKDKNMSCLEADLNRTKIEYSGQTAIDVVTVKNQQRKNYVHVFARMCTKGGCKDSNKATVDPNFDEITQKTNNLGTIIGCSVGALVFILVLVVLYFVYRKCTRRLRRQQVQQLNVFQPDDIGGNAYEKIKEDNDLYYTPENAQNGTSC